MDVETRASYAMDAHSRNAQDQCLQNKDASDAFSEIAHQDEGPWGLVTACLRIVCADLIKTVIVWAMTAVEGLCAAARELLGGPWHTCASLRGSINLHSIALLLQ